MTFGGKAVACTDIPRSAERVVVSYLLSGYRQYPKSCVFQLNLVTGRAL